MTRSRTLRGVVLAGAAALALSACSDHPGSAAVVGSEAISESQLDHVASALCSAQAGSQQTGQSQDLSSRAARQGALDVLVNSAVSRQYGESEGAEPDQEQVSSAIAANQSAISAMPAKHRKVFTSTLREYAEGQLMLIDLGQRELASAGTTNATQEQAIAAGTKLRDAWVSSEHVDVSVDPRYGRYSKGALVPESGSLSVPVSSQAAAGAKPNPSTSWVAELPASQKCS